MADGMFPIELDSVEVLRRGQQDRVQIVKNLADVVHVEHIVFKEFMENPLNVWQNPNTLDRLRFFQGLFSNLIRGAVPFRLVHEIGNYSAVAVWQPNHVDISNYTPLSENDWLVERTFEAKENQIMGDAPVFYHLNLLATDQKKQNQGYAAALLAPMLEFADKVRVPLYLENAHQDETIMKFYQNRGFVVKDTYNFAPGVSTFFMRRDPQN